MCSTAAAERDLRGDRRPRHRSSSTSRRASQSSTWHGGRTLRLEVDLDRPECQVVTAIRVMPGNIFARGSVGVVSRSGTLTYEAVFQTTRESIGQTTAVGIGGDPIKGLEFGRCARHAYERSEDPVDRDDRRNWRSGQGSAAAFLKDEAPSAAAPSPSSVSLPDAPLPAGAWDMPGRLSLAARARDRGQDCGDEDGRGPRLASPARLGKTFVCTASKGRLQDVNQALLQTSFLYGNKYHLH